MLGCLLVFWFTPAKGEEWVYILYPPLRRYSVGAVSRIQSRQCSLLHMTFSFSKHSSVIYACLRHKVILILPVLFRIQDSQREKMKNPAALVFALATLCVMECYVSGIKIYHQRQVIFKFMLLKEKRYYLAVTQEYFTCNKNSYDESKISLSLILSFNFRATIFKTVQLSKRVFRSLAAIEISVIFVIFQQSLPLWQLAPDLLYLGVFKMTATKRHILDVKR